MEDLESLVDASIATAKQEKHQKHKKPEAPRESRALFQDPENWTRVAGVSLIHAESQSFLGNFDKFQHKTVADATKLVRASGPIKIDSSVEVSGEWWLGRERQLIEPQPWHEIKQTVADLNLGDLWSPACMLKIHLAQGGMLKIVLEFEAQFSSIDAKERVIMTLPTGVDVMPELTRECKIDIWKSLQ